MSKTIPRTDWHPASWQSFPASQQASYPDKAALERAVAELSRLPPITTSWEVDALKEHIARAQRGDAFVLQGGDCAETFDECTSESIVDKLKILLQMSLVMIYGLKKPVVRVGRMAGQYAKPRSADTETRDGVTLPSFRGDLVNRAGFTPEDRIPNPQMILRGYERAALTLNFVRSLIDGGFADLHHPEYWDLSWVSHSQAADEYHQIVASISNSLDFLETVSGRQFHRTQRADIYAAQGYRRKAVKIYTELLSDRPDDETIARKLRELGIDAPKTSGVKEDAGAAATEAVGETMEGYRAGTAELTPEVEADAGMDAEGDSAHEQSPDPEPDETANWATEPSLGSEDVGDAPPTDVDPPFQRPIRVKSIEEAIVASEVDSTLTTDRRRREYLTSRGIVPSLGSARTY